MPGGCNLHAVSAYSSPDAGSINIANRTENDKKFAKIFLTLFHRIPPLPLSCTLLFAEDEQSRKAACFYLEAFVY